MAILGKKAKAQEAGDNIFWTTMADLLLGLAIIFMTLFVLAMTGFSQNSVQQKQEQIKASQELSEQLQKVDIEAQVDEMTGDIKISDLELFELNSYQLSPKGKEYLNKLIPIYVNTIFSNKQLLDGIENIVIQGHTDSQSFSGLKTKEEQFTRNMDLSLKRANSVAEYIFKTNYDKSYSDKLRELIVVEGKSFNEPIIVNGVEDFAKSRRVELKLTVKRWDIMQAFGF